MRKPAAVLAAVTCFCILALAAKAADAAGGDLSSALGDSRFLAGQILTILGSVLGVYLASYVSFQRTLKYNRFVRAQKRAALLAAAGEELKQNLASLHKFNERLPAESGSGVTDAEWPRLRLFVWNAAGHSSSAFDLPPGLLAGVQALYEDLTDLLNDRSAHQNFRSLTTSNIYDRTVFKERLAGLLTLAENSILPALNAAAAKSDRLVAKYADPVEAHSA
jgi:hypothetical protein